MSLEIYKNKRNFDKTPEPLTYKKSENTKAASIIKPQILGSKKENSKNEKLEFVIHKHYASHLHFDLRLELDGVLKSWAIPKGPTINLKEKRLAVMVEDHPLEYKEFEGNIPDGNYGAGQVYIWDRGTYHALGTEDREKSSELLREEIEKGHLTFILEGSLLKGEFALVRLKKGSSNDWLFIKKNDEFAKDIDISLIKAPAEDKKNDLNPLVDRLSNLHAVKKSGFIQNLKPMLATFKEKAFDSSEWIFEIKWDGYRAITEIINGKALIYSRNGISFNKQFEPVVLSLEKIQVDSIIFDGEIVVLDEVGKSSFQLLQKYLRTGKGSPVYYIFDILYINGLNLLEVDLISRKEILKEIIKTYKEKLKNNTDNLRVSDYIENNGNDFFKIARDNGLEGIIAKKRNSIYEPDKRSRNWLKIKSRKRQEVIICGYTDPRGLRQKIGSLITGVYDNGDLVFTGQVGGGLDDKEINDLYPKLQKNSTKNQPFKVIPKTNSKPHWVIPSLVAEVEFAEWTGENLMRQPVYIGLRIDKKAEDVIFERVENVLIENINKNTDYNESNNSKTLTSSIVSKIILANPDKIFWPEEKYTKKDLFEYYKKIASFILPYIKDRLQSLNRCPDGISGECFYQKDIDYELPDWLKTKKIYSESRNEYTNYLVCQDLDSLLYMVNLGCIDIHPWSSTVINLEKPDFAILDLDPLDVTFKAVTSVAIEANNLFEKIKINSYCKTTGFKGLHIYIPLGEQYTFDQVLDFIKIIAQVINSRLPDLTSIERSPDKRHGKVYLDCYQNRKGQTVAAPYCIRPVKGANVSTPLLWEEFQGNLDPGNFNISNIFARLDKIGDIWKGVLGPGIDMGKCMEKLKEVLED